MKRAIILVMFLSISLCYSQAYKGMGDIKFQVGANLQTDGTGIMASLDYGLGENISIGVASIYLLGVNEYVAFGSTEVFLPQFEDRLDIKARFNANLGSVINVDNRLDVYPGLHVSLKNFGGHLGVRYFFTSGFGVFSEINVPFAKYRTTALTAAQTLHNQVSVNIGASFNI